MLESFIPGGRGTTVSASNGSAKFGGDQMMLEKLLPDGRQRKPRLREDTNRKVFVGGLNPSTTAEGLRSYFEQFGTVSEASVVIDKVTRTSRGFGFVMFESEIPAGLLEMQHIIESRRCGVRDYGDARENESSM
jgi:RNA recognition motif-containing protein